jgi:hypothetical protein
LLQYLCDRALRDEAESLKEYNIAIDVFGRGADFDQTSDAIVRVEVHRLRKKLEKYYGGEGSADPLRIVIEAGCYKPEFVVTPALDTLHAIPALEERPAPSPVQPDNPATRTALSRFGPFLLILAGLCVGGGLLVWLRSAKPAQARAARTEAAVIPNGGELRIRCGATPPLEHDRDGNRWQADSFFTGGKATSLPVPRLYRTRDSELFSTARVGEFSYKIPLKPGIYELHLYFADTTFEPGPAMDGGENRRVFNVDLNGQPLLKQFDVIADSGPNTADVRAFKDVQPAEDGYLHLTFRSRISEPLLNAIEVLPAAPHHMRTIRLVTQERAYTDSAGNPWMPDNYFLFGRLYPKTGTVSGTRDPELYGWERYGHFSYAIPAAPGTYALTLHFAETYFGAENPGGGGTGSRVFDVLCNGVPLLTDFDLLREGPGRTAIVRTFHGLHPNAQGKLLVSFNPSANYATVSALEVVDESK